MQVYKKDLLNKLNYYRKTRGDLASSPTWNYMGEEVINPVPKMIDFLRLSPEKREEVKAQWIKYFELVKQTRASQVFWKLWPLFKKSTLSPDERDEFDSLLAEAKSINQTKVWLTTPKSANPESYSYEPLCQLYNQLTKKVEEMEKTIQETGDEDLTSEAIFG